MNRITRQYSDVSYSDLGIAEHFKLVKMTKLSFFNLKKFFLNCFRDSLSDASAILSHLNTVRYKHVHVY